MRNINASSRNEITLLVKPKSRKSCYGNSFTVVTGTRDPFDPHTVARLKM